MVVTVAALVTTVALRAQDRDLIIRQLSFEGNHSIDALSLEAAISTTKSSWFARAAVLRGIGLGEKRRLNEREFRVDVARIRLFYQMSGFLSARVDTLVRRTATDAFITFKITEGDPVRVRTLEFAGLDSLADRAVVVRDLPLRVGMPYNRYRLLAAVDTVQFRLWDRGYPSASVLLRKREVTAAAKTADLEIFVDLGLAAQIGSIRVEGNKAVDSSFVRSLLATRTGRMFRFSEVYRSQLNLYQSGLFRFATVGTDTTRFTIGDPTVPLLVQVQEGPLHRARAGLGIATTDCLRASAGWTARNVGGRGRQVDFTGQVSKIGATVQPFSSTICSGLDEDSVGSRKINFGVTASIRRPAFLSPANAITGTLFAERRSEFRVYLREEVGTSVAFTREGILGIPISLAYRIAYGSTQASPVSFCAFFLACRTDDVDQLRERRIAAVLTGSVSRQRVNNRLDPSRGSFYSAELSFSSPLIGSTRFSEFTRVVGEASWYAPLGGSVVLATHLKAGLTFAPQLRLSGGAGNFIPPDQRFYAGGANDVRGFERNQLGPVVYVTPASNIDSVGKVGHEDQVTVAPTGGNAIVIGNLELRVPSPVFADRLRWAVFLDGGGVWERGTSLTTAGLVKLTPGIGLRFATPLGPMRFDVAYNGTDLPKGPLYATTPNALIRVRDDFQKKAGGKINFQISVGQAF